MLHFEPFVTSRLQVKMREIAIGDAMAILLMPEDKPQACTTAFLRAVMVDGGPVPDPLLWTLQERTLAVCHYLMAINPEQPNFAVGKGVLTDYAQFDQDVPQGTMEHPVELGELEGDHWSLQHLQGYMLESIERLQRAQAIAVPGDSARLHWMFASLGAQLVRAGEEVPAWSKPGQYDDWLAERTKRLLSLPESAMAQLFAMVIQGRESLHHFFDYTFSEATPANANVGGPVFLPFGEKEAAAQLHPATFLPIRAVSNLAYSILGKPTPDGL